MNRTILWMRRVLVLLMALPLLSPVNAQTSSTTKAGEPVKATAPNKPLQLDGTVLHYFTYSDSVLLSVHQVRGADGTSVRLNPPRTKRVSLSRLATPIDSPPAVGEIIAVLGCDFGRGKPLLAWRIEPQTGDIALIPRRTEAPSAPEFGEETVTIAGPQPPGKRPPRPTVKLIDGTEVEGIRLLTLEATAYGPGENGIWGDMTKLGTTVGWGTVAVDPRVIRLGSHLWVEGYGFCIALDVGSAIKGARIDLAHNDDRSAMEYGRKKVRVLVLD